MAFGVKLTLLVFVVFAVFGIGTLWDLNGLMGADMCSYNTGTKASDEYQALSGCTVAVPLENDGGEVSMAEILVS